MNVPKIYLCDSLTCTHNNGNGDCDRSTVVITDDGRCGDRKADD